MTILVTGANRGLGLEFTRQLLARGERVIATARQTARAGALNQLAGDHPGYLTVLPLDSGDGGSINELARELALVTPTLDAVIANAGVLVRGERFGEISEADLKQSFRVNALGPVLLTQALTPLLARGKRPRIVYLSSVLGSIASRDSFYVPSYCISKAALNMAMRVLSFALKEHGIIACTLHPGWVRTDMGGDKAPLDAVAAVRDLLAVFDTLGDDHHGRFYAHDGSELPW